MDGRREALDALTHRIIGAAMQVSNTLGCGFLEKVYENALAIELRALGCAVAQQSPMSVSYRGEEVGRYFADLVIEDRVAVEVKTVRALDSVHEAQCLNYLKCSGLRICLLVNFARPRLQFKRIMLG
jgi:GxxExxY protein